MIRLKINLKKRNVRSDRHCRKTTAQHDPVKQKETDSQISKARQSREGGTLSKI